jgi:putative hydrolase of the HAD superfamily
VTFPQPRPGDNSSYLHDHGQTDGGIEAVVFDWGGTLTPWHDVDVAETWRCVARVVHADAPALVEELAARLLAADEAIWSRSREGSSSARFADVLAACQMEATAELLAAHCSPWEPHTLIDPDVPETLAALRERGIKVGLLSNTIWPRGQHEEWLERDGVLHLFDGAVFSSEIAWMKPHPEAFRAAMAAVGVGDPSRAVFVGDRPYDDIHGAKSAGMRAVLVPHSRIPEHERGPVEGEADAVVTRLSDLVPLIDAWR